MKNEIELNPHQHRLAAARCAGLRYAKIAELVGSTEGSVRTQIYFLFKKFSVNNSLQFACAYQKHLTSVKTPPVGSEMPATPSPSDT